MKSTTLVTALTSLTKAMAVAAGVVVFGFLYVLLVQPQRAALRNAEQELELARAELNGRRGAAPERDAAPASAAHPMDEFEARAMEGDRVSEVVDAIAAVVNGPAVGRVSNLAVAIGETGEGPVDSIAAPLSAAVAHTPVTVTFEARLEQIRRFFDGLRVLPAVCDLQGVEVVPLDGSPGGLARVKASILVFHRPGVVVRSGGIQPKTAAVSAPRQPRPSLPDPVVSSILISGDRAVALVDGQVVRPGDRVPAGIVQSIEPEAVVIAGPAGRARRIKMQRE